MKKTITTNIAGTIFNIEVDAYEKLDHYILSIKEHFKDFADKDEIVADIEARIAEQFAAREANNIINVVQVEELVKSMGNVNQFEDTNDTSGSSDEHTKSSTTSKDGSRKTTHRKLYRDTDNKIIAGVASGLAAYFGTDPVVMRLIFIVLLFVLNGGALILYLILAIAIPKATTATEKMQMRGEPVNLSSLEKNIRDNVNVLKDKTHMKDGFRGFIEKAGDIFSTVFSGITRIFGRLLGLVLVAGSAIFICISTFALLNLTLNIHSPYVEFPVAQVITGAPYYWIVALVYIIAIIPLSILCILGLSLILKKKVYTPVTIITLASVWIVALLIAGVMGVRYVPLYKERVALLPQYQTTTREYELKDFTKIDFHGIDTVELSNGPYEISGRGRFIDLDRVDFQVEDGTLVLHQKSRAKLCFFCLGRDSVAIKIQAPFINEISQSGITSLHGSLSHMSTSTMEIHLNGVTATDLTIAAGNVVIDQDGASRLTLNGTADTINITQNGVSKFNGPNFVVKKATVTQNGDSYAYIHAINDLTAISNGISKIVYTGNPHITRDLSGNSQIMSADNVDVEIKVEE